MDIYFMCGSPVVLVGGGYGKLCVRVKQKVVDVMDIYFMCGSHFIIISVCTCVTTGAVVYQRFSWSNYTHESITITVNVGWVSPLSRWQNVLGASKILVKMSFC